MSLSELALHSVIRAFVNQLQMCEDTGIQLYRERIFDLASGDMVDKIGAIVGELRDGRSDVEYKLAILDRILINTVTGTPENVIQSVEILTGAGDVRIRELQPATLEVFTDGEVIYGIGMYRRVKNIIAVGITLILKSFFDGVIFTFAWDGTTPTEGKGFDEYGYYPGGQSVGGQWTELILA